MGIEDNYDK